MKEKMLKIVLALAVSALITAPVFAAPKNGGNQKNSIGPPVLLDASDNVIGIWLGGPVSSRVFDESLTGSTGSILVSLPSGDNAIVGVSEEIIFGSQTTFSVEFKPNTGVFYETTDCTGQAYGGDNGPFGNFGTTPVSVVDNIIYTPVGGDEPVTIYSYRAEISTGGICETATCADGCPLTLNPVSPALDLNNYVRPFRLGIK